jgi:hypothetical protein
MNFKEWLTESGTGRLPRKELEEFEQRVVNLFKDPMVVEKAKLAGSSVPLYIAGIVGRPEYLVRRILRKNNLLKKRLVPGSDEYLKRDERIINLYTDPRTAEAALAARKGLYVYIAELMGTNDRTVQQILARNGIKAGFEYRKRLQSITKKHADEFSPFRRHLDTMHKNCQKTGRCARGITADVTLEDLKEIWDRQGGVCPYTGMKLKIRPTTQVTTKATIDSASVDRIDSSRPYAKDNIQFVSLAA